MTSTATPRAQRTSATEVGRTVRVISPPAVERREFFAFMLPREASQSHAWAVLGAVGGLAIAYAGSIAAPTGTSYDLREVERKIVAEESRLEQLTAERSRLLSLPSVLSRARRFGVVQPAPADIVLAPRP